MAELEELSIRITAESAKAEQSIAKLANRISALSVAVNSLEVGKLNELASSLTYLNAAIINMNGSTSKWDYNKIVTNLSTLSQVNAASLNTLSLSLQTLSTAFTGLSSAAVATQSVRDLVNAIGRLGGVSVTRAITNIPQLESSLRHLIKSFSTLPNVNQSIIDFTNALANLASQGSRIGTASQSISNSLDRFGSAATRATRKSFNLASAIGKVYAQFWIAMRAAKGLKNAFMDAADYLEAYNYFEVTAQKIGTDTFRKAGEGSAEAYAEEFTSTLQRKLKQMSGLELDLEDRLIKTTNAKSLGLNLTELTQYQASIASITNSMGVSQEIAQSTAKAFSMLAADMGSLKNVDFETVAGNLQSGLTGMARSLYRYGIDITQATLEQYAFSYGIEKSVSEMTQAEKAQLRLLAILDQSKVAWGDLAHTINSPSNQLRQLKNNLKEVGTVMGQLFIPVMQNVLPVLNGLSIAIKQLLVDIAGILGIKLDLDAFGTGWADGIEDDIDALDDLDKQVKKTKKGIREFDELKVIGAKDDNGDSLGEQIDLTQQILDATAEYEKVWDEAYEKMRSKAQEIADLISPIFEPVKKIVEDFHVGNFFKAGEDVSGLVTSIFDFFSDAIRQVDWNAIGVKIGEFLDGIDWVGVLKSVGGFIWSGIQAAIDTWVGAFSVAPFETALITAFSVLKFTDIGQNITKNIKLSIKKWLKTNGFDKNFLNKMGYGAIALGISLAFTIDNVQSLKQGKYNADSIQSVLKSLVSSAMAGAGFALTASAIGIASGGLAFTVGATISLLANLIIAKANEPDAQDGIEMIKKSFYDWVEQSGVDTQTVLTNIELEVGDVDAESLKLDDLAQKVKELSLSYDDLTDGEKGLLKYYSDELLKIMPELADSIDEVTGAYIGEYDALDELLEKQKEQMILNSYSGAMSTIMDETVKKQLEIDRVKNSAEEAQKAVNEFLDTRYSKTGYDKEWEGLMNVWGMDEEHAKDWVKWAYEELKKAMRGEESAINYNAETGEFWTEVYNAKRDTYSKYGLTNLANAMAVIDGADDSLTALENDMRKLNDEYAYWEGEYKKKRDESSKEAVEAAEQSNKDMADTINKPTLPNAVQNTVDKIDTKIKQGDTVTRRDMWNMFNGINTSFAGLGDGKVPEEVQSTMANIKKAIEESSPELVNYMAQLKIDMEKAFADAHYDTEGNLIWNMGAITEKLEANFRSIEGGIAGGANVSTVYDQLKNNIKEVFNGDLPDTVKKSLSKVGDAIKSGQAYDVHSALVDLANEVKIESNKIGKNVVIGGIEGLYSGKSQLGDATRNTIQTGMTDTAEKTLGESSPSKVFKKIGAYAVEGAVIGVKDETPSLITAVKSMANSMSTVFGTTSINIPKINYSGVQNTNGIYNSYNNNDNSLFDRMASTMQGVSQPTEVVFRVEGDPHGMFKVIREENDRYRNRTKRSAFA